MAQNDRTTADLWFEALLKQEGLGSQREPDWSAVAGKTVTKNPDYLVDIDGQPVVVEVKSFEPSPERDAVWTRRLLHDVGGTGVRPDPRGDQGRRRAVKALRRPRDAAHRRPRQPAAARRQQGHGDAGLDPHLVGRCTATSR
jgi:hypothetical protein